MFSQREQGIGSSKRTRPFPVALSVLINYFYINLSMMDNLATFSTEFHACREDPTNHPLAFVEYVNSYPTGAINIIFDRVSLTLCIN